MVKYEDCILKLLDGESIKDKYENLKELIELKQDIIVIADRISTIAHRTTSGNVSHNIGSILRHASNIVYRCKDSGSV